MGQRGREKVFEPSALTYVIVSAWGREAVRRYLNLVTDFPTSAQSLRQISLRQRSHFDRFPYVSAVTSTDFPTSAQSVRQISLRQRSHFDRFPYVSAVTATDFPTSAQSVRQISLRPLLTCTTRDYRYSQLMYLFRVFSAIISAVYRKIGVHIRPMIAE